MECPNSLKREENEFSSAHSHKNLTNGRASITVVFRDVQ
jgi:hypothetical protein